MSSKKNKNCGPRIVDLVARLQTLREIECTLDAEVKRLVAWRDHLDLTGHAEISAELSERIALTNRTLLDTRLAIGKASSDAAVAMKQMERAEVRTWVFEGCRSKSDFEKVRTDLKGFRAFKKEAHKHG